MRRFAIAVVVAVPFVLGLALARPGIARTDGPSYATDVEPLLVKLCTKCHSTNQHKAELVLETGRGYAMLVNQASHEVPELMRVKPGDPESSYLWQKLNGTAAMGKQMPRTLFGSRQLPEEDLDLIRRWIATGANP